jgi:hypothetical protein
VRNETPTRQLAGDGPFHCSFEKQTDGLVVALARRRGQAGVQKLANCVVCEPECAGCGRVDKREFGCPEQPLLYGFGILVEHAGQQAQVERPSQHRGHAERVGHPWIEASDPLGHGRRYPPGQLVGGMRAENPDAGVVP